jgi:AmiR/NasT family two-component response regulator
MVKFSKLSRFAMVTGLLALGLMSVGCSSDKITAESVRADASPDLQSVAMNNEQLKNRTARAIDTTARQVWDDIDSIMFWDRPMRMTKYPIR